MAIITNTKFTIYEVYAEAEEILDQPVDIKDISVVCQKNQDIPFASVSSPQGLGRVTCLDFLDTLPSLSDDKSEDENQRAKKQMVTGSINGKIVLWSNGDKHIKWRKIIYTEDNSIDQIRCLTLKGPRCIAFTSTPQVNIYDLECSSRTPITIPGGLGQCI